MNKKLIIYLISFSFVVAQFCTQQVHELVHFFSHSSWEEDFAPSKIYSEISQIKSLDQEQHCEFLQVVAQLNAHAFTAGSLQPKLTLGSFLSAEFPQVLLSFKNFNGLYHRARAPPQII